MWNMKGAIWNNSGKPQTLKPERAIRGRIKWLPFYTFEGEVRPYTSPKS
jgi:hypothetical protein